MSWIRRGQAVAGGEDVVAAVDVDDEVLGGADVEGERRRGDAVEADAGAVGGDGEGLGAVAAVDLDGVVPSPPSLRSVPSPGFQIMRSLPASPKTWSSPSPPVSVSLPAPPNRRSLPPLPSSVSLPAWPKSMVVAGAAGEDVVAGAAEQLRGRQRAVGLVERDGVVAALAEHLDQGRVGDRRRAAGDRDGPAVDEDLSGRIAAGRDGVVLAVAEHRQQAGGGRKRCFGSHCRGPFKW